MSRLASAAAALHASIASVAGETVTYRRGNINSALTVTLTAIPGHPQRIVDESAGGRLETETLEWTVLVSDFKFQERFLPLDGAVHPEPGDRITRSDGSVYELGDPAYRYADSAGVRMRLHSIRVADDPTGFGFP